VPKKRGPKTEVLEELLKRIDGLEKRLGDTESTGAVTRDSPGADHSNTSSVASRKRPATSSPVGSATSPSASLTPSAHIDIAAAPGVSSDEQLIRRLVDIFFERVNGKPYTLFHEGLFRLQWAEGRVPHHILNTLCAVSVRWVC